MLNTFNPWMGAFNPVTLSNRWLSNWSSMVANSPNPYKEMALLGNLAMTNSKKQQYDLLKLYLTLFSFTAQTELAPLQTKEQKKTGDIALVTGGIGGLGTGICRRLSHDGNQVIATYVVQEAKEAKAWQQDMQDEGIHVDIVECDVSDFAACKKMTAQLLRRHKHIDILVNCAGITRDHTLRNMDPKDWHAVLNVNLGGVFNITRHLVEAMAKRRYGRIVSISSVNGQRGQFGQTNYSASKAGMIGFTRSLALELADVGVTVNCVAPGYADTKMVRAVPEAVLDQIIDKIPIKRLGAPAEVADTVSFLASRRCSYVTGSVIPVNGGMFM